MDKLSSYNSRTCDFSSFKEYITEKNKFASRYTTNVYEEPIFRKLKWNTKINMKRNEDNFINKFRATFGDPKDIVVIFGDWEERPGFLRGKEPTKGKSMRTMIRKAGFDVYLLDEFRTSKTCNHCHEENEMNFIKRKEPRYWKKNETQNVWGLLRCKNGNCRRIHNRDKNSASNMFFIATTIILEGKRPEPFLRKTTQTCVIQKDKLDKSKVAVLPDQK